MKVIIKSRPRKSVLKLSEVTNSNGNQSLNRTKMGKCTDAIGAPYDARTGRLKTGLNRVIDNPYKGDDSLNEEFKYISSRDKITKQEEMEIKYGLPKGYLSDAPPSQRRKKGEELTFLQEFKFHLNDGSTVFDTETLEGELAYEISKVCKHVANSEKELKDHLWPHATHYIAIRNESEALKYKRQSEIDQAIANLRSEQMDDVTQIKILKALNMIKGSTTKERAYTMLSDFIRETSEVNSNARKFNDLYNLLSTQEGREDIDAQALLKDLLDNWIISEKAGTYTWIRKGLNLGQRKEDAIRFLIDPNKQPERDELERELKAKRGY